MTNIVPVKPSQNLQFTPELWRPDEGGIGPSNCLAYALNKKELGFPFWKSFTNAAGNKPTCLNAWKHMIRDSLPVHESPPFSLETPLNVRVRAAFAGLDIISEDEAENSHLNQEHVFAFTCSYQHFFRKDSDGTWSHKLGERAPTDKDDKGQKIFRLRDAYFRIVEESLDDPRYYKGYLYFRIPPQGVWLEPKMYK